GFRKPLVVLTPKSLLRHKDAVSPLENFKSGHFREVLDDGSVEPEHVRRVLLCSGKVYYDLLAKRGEKRTTALIRIDQFYPFPQEQLEQGMARYEHAGEWFWVQEESQNMGGWAFIAPLLRDLGCDAAYIGRDASASPATGSHHVHHVEQEELIEAAYNAG